MLFDWLITGQVMPSNPAAAALLHGSMIEIHKLLEHSQ